MIFGEMLELWVFDVPGVVPQRLLVERQGTTNTSGWYVQIPLLYCTLVG